MSHCTFLRLGLPVVYHRFQTKDKQGDEVPTSYLSFNSDDPIIYLFTIFWPFHGFIDSTAEAMTGNRVRGRGSDTQQRDPGRESNPGPLQSLSTWDTRSTN